MGDLTGKVAVVTGASKGIGAEIAKGLAAAGAAVVVNYASSKDGADKVVAAITGKGGKAVAVKADVSKEAEVKALFAETKKAFGRLDVLVNNAGVYKFQPLAEITADEYRRQFDINVLGVLLATREAETLFGPQGGSVINISSVVASMKIPNGSVYSATKAAVDKITQVLAKELGPKNIRVNAINPGGVETEGLHASGIAGSETQNQMVANTPLGRLGQPTDIAPVAVFLASADSGWLTGETIAVDGGMS